MLQERKDFKKVLKGSKKVCQVLKNFQSYDRFSLCCKF